MENEIYLIGGVGDEITLQGTIEAVKNLNTTDPITFYIHSEGGSVFEGLAIYNYIKGLENDIITRTAGIVASIASIIFLAGAKRSVNENDSFLIHLPSTGSYGNAEDLEKTAEQLRDIEETLSKIYAKETKLTAKQALKLMGEGNFSDMDFLKENGFVDEIIKFKAVAKYEKFNTNKMNKETVTAVESLFTKFFNKHFGKDEPKNKIVQDANGVEIEFFKLDKDAEIEIGAEAKIDDKKADGEYVMPDVGTYVFVNGLLDSIVVEETDLEKSTRENSELKDELQTTFASLDEQKKLVSKMKKDFKTFKNKITSEFDFTAETKPTEKTDPTSRTVFEKK